MKRTIPYFKRNITFILGVILLCIMTASQTYTLMGKYEAYQIEVIENQEKLLLEIDRAKLASSFLIYYDVKTVKDNFEIERGISLISDSEVLEVIDAVWVDILRCDIYDGLGFQYWSLAETKSYQMEVGRKQSPWRYGGDIPKIKATCYIDGTVKITTALGSTKALPIESNKFTIGAE